MTTALVLGGAGFIGSHLIPKLLERGYDVHSVDPRHHVLETKFGNSKLRFEEWIRGAFAQKKYDYVFHLAAYLTQFDISQRNHLGMSAFWDTQLDFHVAAYLELNPPLERVVWMSSAATDAKDTENYAFVKYVSERFARWLGKQKVPVAILKPYAGYGPGQSLYYPMPAIIDRALRRDDPLAIWGNLNTVRDWIYIDDLVEAVLMAADGKFPSGAAIPIGTGVGTTFAGLAKLIAHLVGYEPVIQADTSKPVGGMYRVALTGISKEFGFETKVTLEEGVQKCIADARKGFAKGA